MDYTVHGVAKSQTRLSDFHFTSLHNLALIVCGHAHGGWTHVEGPGISEEWDWIGRADCSRSPSGPSTGDQPAKGDGEARGKAFLLP